MGQCYSLHCLDGLPIFQLQGAGVVPGCVRGDWQGQRGADAAKAVGFRAQLVTLVLVRPLGTLNLGQLRVQAPQLQL